MIISGLYSDKTGEVMNVLSTTIPGLFCLAIGVLSIIAMRQLLPERKAPESAFETTTDYTIEFLVPSDSELVGKTLQEAGLIDVKGGTLLELYHFDNVRSSLLPDDPIYGNDHLVYCGQIDELLDLKETHGLVNANHHIFSLEEVDKNRKLRTAFIPFNSPLIGTTLERTPLERETNMTLVAVARRGERINEIPHQVKLRRQGILVLPLFHRKNSLRWYDEEACRDFLLALTLIRIISTCKLNQLLVLRTIHVTCILLTNSGSLCSSINNTRI